MNVRFLALFGLCWTIAAPAAAIPEALRARIKTKEKLTDAELNKFLPYLPATPDLETSDRLGWRVFEYLTRPWVGAHWVEVDFGEVAAGGSPMTPRVARRVLEMFTRLAPQPAAQLLSPREHQVIELLAEGLTNKEIATRLTLSIHTVVEYVGAIYGKLHVNTRAGAVAKAFRSGWM